MQTSKLSTLTLMTFVAVILGGCDNGYDSSITSDSNEPINSEQGDSASRYADNASDSSDFYAPNPAYDSANPQYGTDSEAKTTTDTSIPMEKNVYFKPELASLTDEAESELADLAQNVKEKTADEENIGISVTAFTDTRESDPYQEELSRLRAENVKEFLRKEGVNVSNWEVQTKDIEAADAQADVDRAGENRSRLIVAIKQEFGRIQGS